MKRTDLRANSQGGTLSPPRGRGLIPSLAEQRSDPANVVARARAWIETCHRCAARAGVRLSPARGRGLKRLALIVFPPAKVVARARAWIETPVSGCHRGLVRVVARARAWIETPYARGSAREASVVARARAWIETQSLRIPPAADGLSPARGRGLKHSESNVYSIPHRVVARARAWIETHIRQVYWGLKRCRPRAGVD